MFSQRQSSGQAVQRISRAKRTALHNMRINHRRAHVGHAQHHRNPRSPLRADHLVQPRQIDLEDMAIQKQHRVQCLVLGRRCAVPLHRQVAQECRGLIGAHRFGMPFPMKQDEALRPVQVGPLGAQTVMFHPNSPPHPVQKLLRHAEITNGFRYMKADGSGSAHPKKDRNEVGKMENNHQNRAVCTRVNINNDLEVQLVTATHSARCRIKERVVSLLAKNTKRSRFYN